MNTKGELSREEIDKLTRNLPDLVILNISGGEPFIRADFAEVIKTYYRNTPVKEVTVPTNGTFTEKMRKDCIDILQNCPGLELNVVVSLDGLEKIHDEIRQVKDCYKTAKKSFLMLKGLKEQYPHLQVSVVSTLTSLNQDTVEEFHQEVNTHWQPDIFGMNLIRGEAKKMNLFGVNLKNYKKFFALQSKSRKRGIKSLVRDAMNKLRTGANIRMVEEKKMVVPCQAGNLMGVMYEKGDVYPCELLNGRPLGNVREFDYDFRKLWASERNRAAGKFINESKCYCTHECFQRFNIIYRPSFVLAQFFASLFGKSKIINSLSPNQKSTKMDSGKDLAHHGPDLIQLGKMRGVRVNRESPLEQSGHDVSDLPDSKSSGVQENKSTNSPAEEVWANR